MIKDYKSIFSPKFHLLIIGLVIFQFFIWNLIVSPWELFAITLLLELIIVGIPLTTEFYKRYNQDFFLKSNYLQDRSKRELQVMLFVIVFVDMWIVVFYHIIINYLFQDVFELATANLAGIYNAINYEFLLGDINTTFMFFFFTLMLIISIITMSYFLNHFIENKMFIYGLLVALIVLEIVSGPLFYWHLFQVTEVNDSLYFQNDISNSAIFPKISLIVVPWNYFIFMINFIARKSKTMSEFPILNLWDSTYLDQGFKFVVWYPYIIIFVYFIIPRISRRSFKKQT